MKEVSSADHCNLSGLIVLVVAAAPRLEVPRGLSQYGRWDGAAVVRGEWAS